MSGNTWLRVTAASIAREITVLELGHLTAHLPVTVTAGCNLNWSLFEERLRGFWCCRWLCSTCSASTARVSAMGVGVQQGTGWVMTPSASGAGVQWHVVLWLDITQALFILG